jgi:acetyl esterase/lipase
LEYRLAPEDPFPATIHDAYAAYLYLTQPNHESITLIQDDVNCKHHTAPIDPRDIVLAGDSAGAGIAIAFQLYLRDYVQPSVEPKPEMPPVTVLMSVSAAHGWLKNFPMRQIAGLVFFTRSCPLPLQLGLD